ncbi:MAG: hypothetical protein JWO22_3520 [Frankiales bacterium]|nr:hypothetical protein [Frankiales bacterium]
MAVQHRKRVGLVAMGAVVLLVSACGTTVRHHAGASALDGADNQGLSAPGSTPSPDGSAPGTTTGTTGLGSTGATGAAGSAGSTGSTGALGPTGSTSVPGGTAAAGGSGGASTGSSASGAGGAVGGPAKLAPVQIGITVITDVGKFAPGATAGNEQAETDAAVKYVNAHGGLAGHVLAPVYYNFQLSDPSPYSTSMAAICSSWTQDHKVQLGMFVGAAVPNDLANCLNQHGVAYMSDGSYLHDATTYRQLPNMVSPSELDTSVAAQALLSNLFGTNAITSKDKVGVLVGDNEDAAGRAYNDVILRTLKARHISVNSYPVTFPNSTSDAANSVTQIDNAELHMATDGITRVIFLAPNCAVTFMQQADQQHYSPKYSLTSYDTPAGMIGSSGAPAGQLANTSGIGWNPTTDVGTYGSKAYDNATTKLCRTIEAPTGQDTDRLSEYATQVFCNAILSVQAAANASGAANLTGGAFISGFNALGSSFADSLTLGTRLSSSKHDGADKVRPFAYKPSCSCFRYTAPATSVS